MIIIQLLFIIDTSSTGTITPSSPHTPTAPTVEIPVRKSKSSEFSSIRASLARMIFKVSKAITRKSPPLIDLKSLICLFNSDLKGKLAECNDISSVVHVIEGECSLTDVKLLETVVEEFEVTEAERYIEQYKTTLEQSCHSLSIELCLKEKFDAVNTSPSLKCETATFVFDWRPDEKKLKDIIDILSKTSGKLVKIKYIEEGNSITITCSFPHSLTRALIIKMGENLELLIKNGLMKLTVGYCTIWKKQEIQEPLRQKELIEAAQQLTSILSKKEKELNKIKEKIQELSSLTKTKEDQNEEECTLVELKEVKEATNDLEEKLQTTYKIIKGMRTEIEQILTNKTGLLDQNESLIDIKREIAELQGQISLMSVHTLNKREENEELMHKIKVSLIVNNRDTLKLDQQISSEQTLDKKEKDHKVFYQEIKEQLDRLTINVESHQANKDPSNTLSSYINDSLLGDCLRIIASEGDLQEKWFDLGYVLGFTIGQLHDIELTSIDPIQRTRKVLIHWRSENRSESWEPLAAALAKIGFEDLAHRVKNHFESHSTPEPGPEDKEDHYKGIYCKLCDKYHLNFEGIQHKIPNVDSPPDMVDLINLVAVKIQDKFYQFGTVLHSDDGFLRSLYVDYHDPIDRFIAVFNRWKDNDPDTYTWATVIKVLQSDAIGAYAVAQDVMKHLTTNAEAAEHASN
uniref:Death domain-containing protein n=1 Tax=Amphimedon queenslandica TaxID=400682 RepID=A0A1X7THE4_AMPQE